ncbi:hypothetical protein GCM10022243_48150 [Saccharothrix violaceirubra]|uniref:DUF3168 domain-containing protein n=1 Tax=Saccharothrix violaceirubra TaxID=413306 RepID=A0A7W7WUV5_9PSEU|nr:DUF3168 domain-containing protein [Saccharothrix violaceirubra]MBB4963843.1 hypothetical protein [Saccharothrix violaceirubra]
MESVLPWIPPAIRRLLLADPLFAAAVPGGRVSTRAPGDVTTPFVTIQLPTPLGAMGGGGYKPLVQVDAWSATVGGDDPEGVVWRIAMTAKNTLERARNVPYQSMHYSCRVLDAGPLPPDTSRGTSSPLYRAMVRVEMTVHNT